MTSSTLTPENLPAGPDRRVHQGHGTAALGPSDSSDSGSDVKGVKANEEDVEEGADIGADIGADRIERIADEDDEPDH